jgi:hypothetical protein
MSGRLFNTVVVYTEFSGESRSDWWGDDDIRSEIIKDLLIMKYEWYDFLSEIREEALFKIKNRNYPPGFNFYKI